MYNHKEIDKKWRKAWLEEKTYKMDENAKGEKCYSLVMFPYPSGDGLHIGHTRTYVGSDIYSRKKRMEGFNVLQPIGWDAFGLPAEEYAIKNKLHPKVTTKENIGNFKEQFMKLGISYDWDREISTTNPLFYKWTQWIFLQLFKKGLAYESHSPVNWCPSCKTGLANEDLEGGKCERCSSEVERKPVRQWVLKITEYADQLVDDLEELVEWPDHVREVQKNWIGRGEGYMLPFKVNKLDKPIRVFTTRPDTIYGCSFIALSTESEVLDDLMDHIENKEEVEKYRTKAYTAKAFEEDKEQTGVKLEGVIASHPITGEDVPIFTANFVISGYGTGAVFGSPAHDQRDFNFAKRYNLPIVKVIDCEGELPIIETKENDLLINSGEHTGIESEKAKKIITDFVGGKIEKVYRLQDWVFSRQRYWGEPIPLIHCEKCGVVPVNEEDLPVVLPEVESYEPTGKTESPLAAIDSWVNVDCPKCGGKGKRETNTMPQWAGSSWYHLRYIDLNNKESIIDKDKEKKFMPVDVYTGGLEHAARHLIYARFWHKFLRDIGVVSTSEPYKSLKVVGIVQAEDGSKMSKRYKNVVNPDDLVDVFGADAVRVAIAQIAPFSHTVAWDSNALTGPKRFLEKVYSMKDNLDDSSPDTDLLKIQNKTLLSVLDDIEKYKFNTAVSAIMIFVNELQKRKTIPKETYVILLQMLAPFAPHITEEIWQLIGNDGSIHLSKIPEGDREMAKEDLATIAIQVSGKTRGSVTVEIDSDEESVMKVILLDERLKKYTENLEVKKFIKNRIISFV